MDLAKPPSEDDDKYQGGRWSEWARLVLSEGRRNSQNIQANTEAINRHEIQITEFKVKVGMISVAVSMFMTLIVEWVVRHVIK